VGHARARKIPAQLVEDEDYQLRYERVAGIDVAKAKADVCTRLPPAREGGRRVSRVEEVPATAREVLALAGRLLADGVQLVVMEATSDYWRIWFYLLEGAGLRVQLVNSRHARQLAGRPKTDRKDAQWIARLAEMGLLRPSFVPPPEIRALRDLTRTRLMLVRDRTREWQRLEKLLEGALVKLSSVVHSLARTKTARDILEAIAAGERDPETLAALAHGGVKGGPAAVRAALDGMRLGGHHPRLVRVHLDHVTLLDRSVAAIEDEIEAALDAIGGAWGISADGVPSPAPGPDAAALAAAERLAEIPGVSPDLARAIIAESGSPGASPRQGPLRTVRARHPGTRLKQAPGALRVVVLASCACGPEARARRRRVSGGFGFDPARHARRGGRGSQRRLPCGPCSATSVPTPGGTGAAVPG
jgi:transposase